MTEKDGSEVGKKGGRRFRERERERCRRRERERMSERVRWIDCEAAAYFISLLSASGCSTQSNNR